jgi:hypothetical protein
MRIKFRDLKANEIECRLGGKVNENQNYYLLYQDSRTTMEILDEYFGNFGWQIDYKEVNGQTYGLLSVYDTDKKVWITKSDTGDESNISQKKGQSSDILKRCAVRLGIARKLYTAPRIILPNTIKGEVKVKTIHYDDEKIILLELENNNKLIYHWDTDTGATLYINNSGNAPLKENAPTKQISKEDIIKDVKNKANELYPTIEDNNKEEFKNCINYYIKRIEQGKWNGSIDVNKVWEKWLNSEFRKAS